MNREVPAIGQARVHAFPLDVSAARYAQCEQWLSADELSRANRFLLPDVRRRFVVSRGSLRELLGEMLSLAPQDLGFRYEKWGKPQIMQPSRSGFSQTVLHFNVAHSGEWALIAVARSPLGVDLEVPNDRISYRAIASQILSPREQVAWENIPAKQRDAATMQLWVCKESLLKALGLGIADGLQHISFPLPIPLATVFSPQAIDACLQMHLDDDGTCRMTHWIDAQAWHLRMLDFIPGTYASICTAPSIGDLSWSVESDFNFL